jgi:hypothetical protein
VRIGGTVAAIALIAAGASPTPLVALPIPEAPNCSIFPDNSVWNQRVNKLPKKKNSDAIIESIGRDEGLHPDFGSGKYDGGPIGIPYTVVGAGQKKSKVKFLYGNESDKGPYPIPQKV